MERPIEMPPIEIPDEVTQVDRPEIGETTPHPTEPNPQAPADRPEKSNPREIGFK